MPDFFKRGYTNTLIFDREYPPEKIAEGRAINWAVLSGACDNCGFIEECRTNRLFKFPDSAACMKKKKDFMEN